jgi:hypothetical protein
MKKLLLLVSCFCATSLFGYTWNVFNNTKGKISVVLDAIARPNYTKELNPGETWTLDTIGWCVRKMSVSGKNGSVQGLYKEEPVPSISCKGYDVTIGEENYYRYEDPLTGNVEIRAKNLAFRWGIV